MNRGWLQTELNTLMELFDRVGLQTNFRKIVGMVCQPFRAIGFWEDEAYKRRMSGEGRSYQERQREWVQYRVCREDLSRE